MSKKNKNIRVVHVRTEESIFARARLNLEKKKYRLARDDFKSLYKLNSQRYAQDYLRVLNLFAEELEAMGMFEQAKQLRENAKEVAEEFLKSNNSSMDVQIKLHLDLNNWVEATKIVGECFRNGKMDTAESTLSLLIADVLILLFDDPFVDTLNKSLPEAVRIEREAILTALKETSAKNWEAVSNALRTISRKSLFAEWKLFIKGMVAFHQGSYDVAEDALKRLTVNSKPHAASKQYLEWIQWYSPSHPVQKYEETLEYKNLQLRMLKHCFGENHAKTILEVDGLLNGRKTYLAWRAACSIPQFPSLDHSYLGVLSFYLLQINLRNLIDIYRVIGGRVEDYFLYHCGNPSKAWYYSLFGCALSKDIVRPDYIFTHGYIDKLIDCFRKDPNLDIRILGYVFEKVAENYFDNDCLKEAIAFYRRAIEMDRECVSIWLKLCETLEEKKEYSERNKCLDQMTVLFPHDKSVLRMAGLHAFDRKAYSKASEFFEQAITADKFDSELKKLSFFTNLALAESYCEKKNFIKFKESYAKIIETGIDYVRNFHSKKDYLEARRQCVEIIYQIPEMHRTPLSEKSIFTKPLVFNFLKIIVASEQCSLSEKKRNQFEDSAMVAFLNVFSSGKNNKKKPIIELVHEEILMICLLFKAFEDWYYSIFYQDERSNNLPIIRKPFIEILSVYISNLSNKSEKEGLDIWTSVLGRFDIRNEIFNVMRKSFPNLVHLHLFGYQRSKSSYLNRINLDVSYDTLKKLRKDAEQQGYPELLKIIEEEERELDALKRREVAHLNSLSDQDENDVEDENKDIYDDDFNDDEEDFDEDDFDDFDPSSMMEIDIETAENSALILPHEHKKAEQLYEAFIRAMINRNEKSTQWLSSLSDYEFTLLKRMLYASDNKEPIKALEAIRMIGKSMINNIDSKLATPPVPSPRPKKIKPNSPGQLPLFGDESPF